MNRDDIIRMAKEAGFNQILATTTGANVWIDDGFYVEELERFAALVAAAEQPKPSEDIKALRRDAERYRWMKQEVKRIPPSWGLIGWDAAIDAAMEDKP